MNLKNHLTDYVRFNLWANTILTDWLLSQDSMLMELNLQSSFPTINKTLVHIWVAEFIWMCRIQNRPFENTINICEGENTKFIVSKLLESSKYLITFIEELSDEDLTKDVNYRLMAGTEGHATIAQILQHVVNHGTYHRGQLVTMGRELGIMDPANTDYMGYCRINN